MRKTTDIDEFIASIQNPNTRWYVSHHCSYVEMPAAFDIETSSFYVDGVKQAAMYLWQFGYGDTIIYGRHWEDFVTLINRIAERLKLSAKRRLIVGVHNLSYEFQFIRKWFNYTKVFALAERKPVYAITDNGIEFRCTYIQSGKSLATLSHELRTHKAPKLVGTVNYNLLRLPDTELTSKEIKYALRDVEILLYYLAEQAEQDGGYGNILLTMTSYVRKHCRDICLQDREHMRYVKASQMTLDEYRQLKRAFAGGFTHTNFNYSGETRYKVRSYDFTSSYPAVMLAYQYPYGCGELVNVSTEAELIDLMRHYSLLFDIKFINIRPKVGNEHIISVSKCYDLRNYIADNGRLVTADSFITTITDVDFVSISKFYTWDKIYIANCRRYYRAYLPTAFVKIIWELYCNKTKLKNVPGKEDVYDLSKSLLNSLYGMTVTDTIGKEEFIYKGEWGTEAGNIEERLNKYNNDKSRFSWMHIGVWCTAYARQNLFSGILAAGDDYIYSDTDSIKLTNADRHQDYFDRYNKWITAKIEKAMMHHGIDYAVPTTVKGVPKPIGVWDFDGDYSAFKSLGAKRYIYKEKHKKKMKITVAGVDKKAGAKFLNAQQDPFATFTDGLLIPQQYSGKLTHTYIDEEIAGQAYDHNGKLCSYHELSYTHLEPTTYDLSRSGEYIRFLKGVKYYV